MTDVCFSHTGGLTPWRKPQFYRMSQSTERSAVSVRLDKFSLSRLNWLEGDTMFCRRTSVKGHDCLLFVDLRCPLPAVAAGVTLRAAGGVSPDTYQCGTLMWPVFRTPSNGHCQRKKYICIFEDGGGRNLWFSPLPFADWAFQPYLTSRFNEAAWTLNTTTSLKIPGTKTITTRFNFT